ncbi:MAG: 3D domain-containing protein [Acidobacteriota bacterium]|nr:3D domain-containing protein [Acidobacteriota bacterium]
MVSVLLPQASGASRLWRLRHRSQPFIASAFSVKGTTADGGDTHRGIVAADPTVLPLGSKIRIRGAGRYSGVYTVTDTGDKVNGRHVDIFMPDEAAAKKFGKKSVTIDVLQKPEASK